MPINARAATLHLRLHLHLRLRLTCVSAVAALCLSLASNSAGACFPGAPRADGFQGRQFEWENDAFARSDRFYTNGLRLSWVYCERENQQAPLTKQVLRLGRVFLGDEVLSEAGTDRDGRPLSRGLATTYQVGQNIYTPQYIVRADSISNGVPWEADRPWSGLLYGGVGVFGYRGDWYHATDLKFGVAGRGSGAARVQREFHRVIDSDYPEGWEGQTERRWAVQMGHMRIKRFGDSEAGDRFGFHLGGAVNVGTIRSYGTLLAGMTVGSQPGPNPVFAISNEGDLVIQDFGKQAFKRWLFFAGASLTWQGSNHLITGATRGQRPDVQLRRWVGSLQFGVSSEEFRDPFGGLLFDGVARVIYTHTHRTADFESRLRPGQKPVQRIGTVSINWSIR